MRDKRGGMGEDFSLGADLLNDSPESVRKSLARHNSGLPRDLATGLEQTQLPGLDGLRAVAVLLVVVYHFGFQRVPGGEGVLIFFVISGFLITWLLLKENEKFGTISLRKFYARRSLRIFPAFYAYCVLYFLVMAVLHRKILWNQAICALIYVNNYFQALHGDPNTGLSHTWSLAIEEQFYIAWASIFLLLRKQRIWFAWILIGAITTIWIYRELLIVVAGVWQGYVYEAFDTRADHLLIGCLLAIILRSGLVPRMWQLLCSRLIVSVAFASLLVVSMLLQAEFGSNYRDSIAFIVDPIVVAILIVQVIAFRGTLMWSWLNIGWVRYLGRVSYSIYLYQQIALEPIRKRLAGFPVFIQLIAAMAATVLLASASYFIVEKPFLKLKDAFRGVPAASAPAAKDAAFS